MIQRVFTVLFFAIVTVVGLNLLLYIVSQVPVFTLRNIALYTMGGLLLLLILLTILSAGAYAEPPPIFKFLRVIFLILVFSVPSFLAILFIILFDFWTFIQKYNFFVCFFVVIMLLQALLRKNVYSKLTWKKITDNWLKWSGYSGLTVGGFGVIFVNEDLAKKIFKITTDSPYVNPKFLISIYIFSLLLFGLGYMTTSIGKTKSDDENSSKPKGWFISSCIFIWLASLGLYTLFFNSIILTINAHLSTK